MKSYVYQHAKNAYLQIKKYDEGKKLYQCRLKEETQQQNQKAKTKIADDVEVAHEEISDQINVLVRMMTEDS
jgi:hypothetical protein